MNMRETISLVESQILLEAAGTYGFYNPSTDVEVLTDGPYSKEHADASDPLSKVDVISLGGRLS